MRKLWILLVLMAGVSSAQIKKVETADRVEIGKAGTLGQMWVTLEKAGNKYYFTYLDAQYKHAVDYKSFSFEETGTDLDDLYKMIQEGFASMPEKDQMIELPDDVIWLHFQKNMGVAGVQFIHAVGKSESVIGKSQYLNKKQIDKLFGKKK